LITRRQFANFSATAKKKTAKANSHHCRHAISAIS
jgi:hypothetical protein